MPPLRRLSVGLIALDPLRPALERAQLSTGPVRRWRRPAIHALAGRWFPRRSRDEVGARRALREPRGGGALVDRRGGHRGRPPAAIDSRTGGMLRPLLLSLVPEPLRPR